MRIDDLNQFYEQSKAVQFKPGLPRPRPMPAPSGADAFAGSVAGAGTGVLRGRKKIQSKVTGKWYDEPRNDAEIDRILALDKEEERRQKGSEAQIRKRAKALKVERDDPGILLGGLSSTEQLGHEPPPDILRIADRVGKGTADPDERATLRRYIEERRVGTGVSQEDQEVRRTEQALHGDLGGHGWIKAAPPATVANIKAQLAETHEQLKTGLDGMLGFDPERKYMGGLNPLSDPAGALNLAAGTVSGLGSFVGGLPAELAGSIAIMGSDDAAPWERGLAALETASYFIPGGAATKGAKTAVQFEVGYMTTMLKDAFKSSKYAQRVKGFFTKDLSFTKAGRYAAAQALRDAGMPSFDIPAAIAKVEEQIKALPARTEQPKALPASSGSTIADEFVAETKALEGGAGMPVGRDVGSTPTPSTVVLKGTENDFIAQQRIWRKQLEAGEIDTNELGRRVAAFEVVPEAGSAPKATAKKTLLDQYDDGEITASELRDKLIAKANRSDAEELALAEYERGYAEHLANGMRMDNFSEEYMVDALRKGQPPKPAAPEPKASNTTVTDPPKPKAQPKDIDPDEPIAPVTVRRPYGDFELRTKGELQGLEDVRREDLDRIKKLEKLADETSDQSIRNDALLEARALREGVKDKEREYFQGLDARRRKAEGIEPDLDEQFRDALSRDEQGMREKLREMAEVAREAIRQNKGKAMATIVPFDPENVPHYIVIAAHYIVESGYAVEATARKLAKQYGLSYAKALRYTQEAMEKLGGEFQGARLANTDATRAQAVHIANAMPELDEYVAAALAGRSKRGWYKNAEKMLRAIFGDDTDRFVGVLAATSPRQGVADNLKMAINVWRAWNEAGRPQTNEALERMFGKVLNKDGKEVYDLVQMEGRVSGTIQALMHPKPEAAADVLNGFKVESFRRNLVGDQDVGTNDSWMAQFAGILQALFGTRKGYDAGEQVLKRAAEELTKRTGERWTVAEVQETVWSFYKTLVEKSTGGKTPTKYINDMVHGDVAADMDDFAALLLSPEIRENLRKAGIKVNRFDLETLAGDGGADMIYGGLKEGRRLSDSAIEDYLSRGGKLPSTAHQEILSKYGTKETIRDYPAGRVLEGLASSDVDALSRVAGRAEKDASRKRWLGSGAVGDVRTGLSLPAAPTKQVREALKDYRAAAKAHAAQMTKDKTDKSALKRLADARADAVDAVLGAVHDIEFSLRSAPYSARLKRLAGESQKAIARGVSLEESAAIKTLRASRAPTAKTASTVGAGLGGYNDKIEVALRTLATHAIAAGKALKDYVFEAVGHAGKWIKPYAEAAWAKAKALAVRVTEPANVPGGTRAGGINPKARKKAPPIPGPDRLGTAHSEDAINPGILYWLKQGLQTDVARASQARKALERKTGRNLVGEMEDLEEAINRQDRLGHKIEDMVERGIPGKDDERLSMGVKEIRDILDKGGLDAEMWQKYRRALRENELFTQGRGTIEVDDVARNAKFVDDFLEYARREGLTETLAKTDAEWQRLIDSHLDLYEKYNLRGEGWAQGIRDQNAFYFPLHTAKTAEEATMMAINPTSVASPGGKVIRARGSNQYIDGFAAMAREIEKVVRVGEATKGYLPFLDTAAKTDGMEMWVKEITKEAGDMVDDIGVDVNLRAKGIDEFIEGQDAVMSVYDKGKLRQFKVDPHLWDAIRKGMPAAQNPWLSALQIPSKIARAGTTGVLNPLFQLVFNPLIDIASASVTHGVDPLSWAIGAIRTAGRGKYSKTYREAIKDNVFFNSKGVRDWIEKEWIYDPDTRNAVQRGLEAALESKGVTFLRAPYDLLQYLGQTMEEATRLTVYTKSRNKALKAGRTLEDAGRLAAYDAANTINFAEAGVAPKALRRIGVPYASIPYQVATAHAKAFKKAPVKYIARAAAIVAAPAYIEWSLYHDDPEWVAMPDYAKYGTMMFRDGIFKGKPNEGEWVAMRIPEELGLLVKRPMHDMLDRNVTTDTAKEIIKGEAMNFVPSAPTWMALLFQQMFYDQSGGTYDARFQTLRKYPKTPNEKDYPEPWTETHWGQVAQAYINRYKDEVDPTKPKRPLTVAESKTRADMIAQGATEKEADAYIRDYRAATGDVSEKSLKNYLISKGATADAADELIRNRKHDINNAKRGYAIWRQQIDTAFGSMGRLITREMMYQRDKSKPTDERRETKRPSPFQRFRPEPPKVEEGKGATVN